MKFSKKIKWTLLYLDSLGLGFDIWAMEARQVTDRAAHSISIILRILKLSWLSPKVLSSVWPFVDLLDYLFFISSCIICSLFLNNFLLGTQKSTWVLVWFYSRSPFDPTMCHRNTLNCKVLFLLPALVWGHWVKLEWSDQCFAVETIFSYFLLLTSTFKDPFMPPRGASLERRKVKEDVISGANSGASFCSH